VRLFIAISLFPLMFAGCSRRAASGPVDATFTRGVDVTGDGEDDMVTLHVTGPSPAEPYQWTLTIESEGRTIHQVERNDADVDPLFNDTETLDCKSYADCKQRYYAEQILDGLIPADLDIDAMLDRQSTRGLYGAGRMFLRQCCSRAGSNIEKMLRDIETRLREGSAVVIMIPDSPEMAGPLLVYSADAGVFVPVYKEP
jgi:hypothetical protein